MGPGVPGRADAGHRVGGLFEKVVAPNHQIESAESINVLSEYLSNGAVRKKGWMTLADAEYPTSDRP